MHMVGIFFWIFGQKTPYNIMEVYYEVIGSRSIRVTSDEAGREGPNFSS